VRVLRGRPSSSFPRNVWISFLGVIFFFFYSSPAYTQTPSATSQTSLALQPNTSQNTPKQNTEAPSDEIVSHDTPATFKVRVNLVLVRVVVRDSDGKVVTNLKKEDFRLVDNRKLQAISSFSTETPAPHAPTVKKAEATPNETPVKLPGLPQRFVTLFFDDLLLSTQDIVNLRQAAMKLFAAMGASDRIAIFTTSGEVSQDFTSDREKLNDALLRIKPVQNSAVEAVQKLFPFINLNALIRRMNALPGQHVIVMMSPGFVLTPEIQFQISDILDRAIKANIAINTIDARGLYVSSVYDASTPALSASVAPLQAQIVASEELAQQAGLVEWADGTGGVFFHDRNDIDQVLLQAAAVPEVSYVLGFAPQNLKLDGSYHNLKVTLANKEKWTLQARHGYFAPKGESDPEATAKEEIRQAIFSQEEMRELPIDSQTQFFKAANAVRLSVVTHLNTTGLKFRKAEDRNNDNLTISTAIFDGNGILLTGQEKILELSLKDATLERVNRAGLTVKASFDLQPGTFLVRVVARDSEGAQMGAMNRGVVIPQD
jgi:VWFA-related protein